ncbi:hypothetical protein [Cupriavidus sp. 8B]
MKNIFVDIPAPSYWQDFELLTLDICRIKWGNDYAERNGREGQKQAGVDVYGYNYSAREETGVQCKKRKTKIQGVRAPASSLTTDEIDDEVNSATSFLPKLDRFIIATTGPRDSNLQAYARALNAATPPFQVALWFWDDYVEFLNSNDNLMYRYYANILKYRELYSQDEHFLRMLALAFDRPAIRTAFHQENRAVDFIEAISALQQAVTTGVLKDRTGHVIDEARPPTMASSELKTIRLLLNKVRSVTTNALRQGLIIEHGTVIEILERSLQDEINKIRKDIVVKLNQLLLVASIDPIEIREY